MCKKKNSADEYYSKRITSFHDLEQLSDKSSPVCLMYSGGLDSTYALYKLSSMGFTDIHAIAVNIGQQENFDNTRNTAEYLGSHFHYIDKQDEFANNNVLIALQVSAKYLGNYPVSSSLSRPIIASTAVELSEALGATMLIHTANLSQNSLPRLNNAIQFNNFSGNYGSPYIHSAVSREQKSEELKNIGLPFISERKLSGDSNLWCNEFESGPLDDPEDFAIPDNAFIWTRAKNPSETTISITVEKGIPTKINDQAMSLRQIIESLNDIIGSYGLGRYIGLEHLSTDSIKVLEVREAPAAMILFDTYSHLETAILDINALELKQNLSTQWVIASVNGQWGGTKHTACQHAIISMVSKINGVVTYNINSSRIFPLSIKADHPLYVRDRDAWEIKKSREGSYHG